MVNKIVIAGTGTIGSAVIDELLKYKEDFQLVIIARKVLYFDLLSMNQEVNLEK